ncbi:hypothetical protein JRQ81_005824 [Phrynocephalus forsythii]|uniref:Uncharacterized protein n=1 Tax=Phrynocephalus forsythii TaxID=171643 RepID=A0A9Q1AW21_9SAUR|nr:hypothetical protein JRQ81_005824 [Phrynocephalus forsythii]
MGRGKRSRATDEGSSPPRSKQPKIDSFSPTDHNMKEGVMNAVEKQNSFHLLDALMTGTHERKRLPGALSEGESEVEKEPGGYREVPLSDALPLPPFSSKQDSLKQNAQQYGAVSDQIHLIIRALCCIFKNIEEISLYLDKLSQVLSAHLPALTGLPGLHQNPTQSIEDLKQHQIQEPCSSSSVRASSKQPETQRSSQSLILQPNKICLTVRYRWAKKLKWNNLKMAKGYLRDLLQIPLSQVDFISVDSLNDAAWPKKFLLSFESPRLPSLVIRRKDSMARWDVFPTRVFRDSNVKPLLVKTSVNKDNSPTVSAPNIKPKPLNWESFLIPTTPRVLSPETVGNDPLVNGWDSAEEKNLIISYDSLKIDLAIAKQLIGQRMDDIEFQINHSLGGGVCSPQYFGIVPSGRIPSYLSSLFSISHRLAFTSARFNVFPSNVRRHRFSKGSVSPLFQKRLLAGAIRKLRLVDSPENFTTYIQRRRDYKNLLRQKKDAHFRSAALNITGAVKPPPP